MSVKSSTSKKRTEGQKEADAARISDLTIKGYSSYQIAEILASERPYRITRQQVEFDRNKIERQWGNLVIRTKRRVKAKLIEEVNLVRRIAYAALEKSQADLSKIRVTRRGKELAQTMSEKVGQSGDVGWARVILECNKREAELMGLDDYNKVTINSGVVTPPENVGRVVLYLPDNQRGKPIVDVEEAPPPLNGNGANGHSNEGMKTP